MQARTACVAGAVNTSTLRDWRAQANAEGAFTPQRNAFACPWSRATRFGWVPAELEKRV